MSYSWARGVMVFPSSGHVLAATGYCSLGQVGGGSSMDTDLFVEA